MSHDALQKSAQKIAATVQDHARLIKGNPGKDDFRRVVAGEILSRIPRDRLVSVIDDLWRDVLAFDNDSTPIETMAEQQLSNNKLARSVRILRLSVERLLRIETLLSRIFRGAPAIRETVASARLALRLTDDTEIA